MLHFTYRSLVFVIISMAPFCWAGADESERDEIAAKISKRLERAKIAQGFAIEGVEVSKRHVDLLQKRLDARREIVKLTNRIAIAEQKGDRDTVESLSELVEGKEVWLDVSEGKLELYQQSREFLHSAQEITLESSQNHVSAIKRVMTLQHERMKVHDKLLDALEQDDEKELWKLEEKLESLASEAETRFEIIELERAMVWAEAESEEEEIEEIGEQLERLRGELDDSTEEQTEEAASVGRNALPIKLTTAEILATADSPPGAPINGSLVSKRMLGLLKSTCFDCHGNGSESGDLNLETLVSVEPLVAQRKHWINVIEQLKNRSMPPADSEPMPEPDRRYMAAWLTNAIMNFDYTTVRQVGREPAKRLTRDEYNHTVRDLFGTDLRPADKFPSDMAASSGFDNSGNSLFIHPITMERYVGAADAITTRVFNDDEMTQRFLKLNAANTDPKKIDARKVIGRFASRAYRRPVPADELGLLVKYFDSLVARGEQPLSAIGGTTEAILVSPSFLIRSEQTRDSQQPYRISNWELATRLSYFLWASMPDEELFRLARSGQLQVPANIAKQVDRMLVDQKSETLGSLFAAQWLGYNDLNRVRPGPIDNPWCTDSLCDAMLKESGMFFHSLVTANAPIDRLIDGDYTFLNEELAKHYKIPGIQGDAMRRVALDGQPRGGILSHASVLAITSFPGRTSPVLRGNWILSELLGTPPPPPPPNASEFDESISENNRLTQRQKLQRHRDNPNCYACHSQIDPLGFSLERYDWFGRFRPQQKGRKLSAVGKFPDGNEFVGLRGLQNVIKEDRMNDLVTQLTRKMLSYALGRQLEFYDEATVGEIVAKTNSDGRRIRTLIQAIVASDTFQMQQPSPPKASKAQ